MKMGNGTIPAVLLMLLTTTLCPYAGMRHSLLPSMILAAAAAAAACATPLKLVRIPKNLPLVSNLTSFQPNNSADGDDSLPHQRAYLLTTTESWIVLVPEETYHHGHHHHTLKRTSQQARRHQCSFATNGGPFHAGGSCVGAVMVHGHVVDGSSSFGNGVGFGIAHRQDEREWVIGSIHNVSQATYGSWIAVLRDGL